MCVTIIGIDQERGARAGGDEALEQTQKTLGPMYQVALLATLVLLFGFQGEQILSQPLIILLIAVPILIQLYFNSGLVYWLNRQFGVAVPSALIGASNFLNSRWLRPSFYSGSIPGRFLRQWSAYSLRCQSCCLLCESSTIPKAATSPA